MDSSPARGQHKETVFCRLEFTALISNTYPLLNRARAVDSVSAVKARQGDGGCLEAEKQAGDARMNLCCPVSTAHTLPTQGTLLLTLQHRADNWPTAAGCTGRGACTWGFCYRMTSVV
ncbi:hypothetical protein AOLI_G00301790 [Acnodon oligacanthus]